MHDYHQGGEFSDDGSSDMQQRRNRSTRSLWDPSYVDESWINDRVQLIPRLKNWVTTYYPGTLIGYYRVQLGRRKSHQRRKGLRSNPPIHVGVMEKVKIHERFLS